MGYNVPFCYSFDSDNPDIKSSKGYTTLSTTNFVIGSNELTYSGDKFMQFVAWNTDLNQKVIKRWKFVEVTGGQYVNVIQARDNEFKFKAISSKVGDTFVVIGLNKMWEAKSGFIGTKEFKIVKDSATAISIYTYYDASWHQLYCNKGAWFGVFRSNSMKISDVSDSLSDTLDKNCAWSY